MTAPVTSYTTTDAVRSCMGVTDNEMSDDFFRDMGLSSSVIVSLESFLSDHQDRWGAFKSADPTSTQIQIGRSIPLYCAWTGAMYAWNGYMAVPKDISDGKSSLSRFSENAIDQARKGCERMSNRYKSLIQTLVGTSVHSAASPMGRAVPSFDPVTGTQT